MGATCCKESPSPNRSPSRRRDTVVGAARAAILATALTLSAGPAAAQFGGPFDTPRPPGNVPARPPAQPAPPQSLQPPQPPTAGPLPPPGPPGRSAIQSEELPPPGAAPPQPAALPLQGAVPPQPPQPPQSPQPATPPGARQQRGAALPGNAAPPAEDVVTQPPSQKIANPSAVFSGLDKITGRITAFDAAIGETVQFGALQVTARACFSRPPTETPLTDGFVEVDEVTLQGEVRRIFTGWMFAASPGLHAVEHPIYDVWLTGCKGGAPAVADAQPAPPAPPAAAPPARPAQQRQAAPRAPAAAPQYPGGQRQTLPPPGTLLAPGPGR
jgi:hypothetical protein